MRDAPANWEAAIKEAMEALESVDVDESVIAMYWSASMRLAYLPQDRPDVLVVGKALAKGLKRPNQALADVAMWNPLSPSISKIDSSASQPESVHELGIVG